MRHERKKMAELDDIQSYGVGFPHEPISMTVQGLRRAEQEGTCTAT